MKRAIALLLTLSMMSSCFVTNPVSVLANETVQDEVSYEIQEQAETEVQLTTAEETSGGIETSVETEETAEVSTETEGIIETPAETESVAETLFETEAESELTEEGSNEARVTSGPYVYTVKGVNATITSYTGSSTNVEIPSKIDGYTVVGIASKAFSNNTTLLSVKIPGTVTKIGDNYSSTGAFANCKKLQSVIFEEGTADAFLGWNTFQNCYSLTSIVIPGNYTTIGNAAFENCTALRSMELKESDYSYANQVIGAYAFSKCTNLGTIKLPKTLRSINEYAFRENAATNIAVPEGVEKIERAAFASSPNLKTVSIPSTMVTIGTDYSTTGAFEGCPKLSTVTIAEGENDAFLGWNTFRNCVSLTSIVVPGNYTAIGNAAFENCTGLRSMEYKQSDYSYANQVIGGYAFSKCTNLGTIKLPITLKKIGEYAFRENAATNIVIPEGVETIERAVFASSPNLKTVSIPSTVVTIGTDYSTTGAFEGCPKLTTVTIAEGTEDAFLGWSTFRNCVSLTDIVIPGNYTAIGQAAFENCTGLRSMEYKQSDYSYANQVIGAYAFSKCTNLGTIKLPITLKKIGEYAFRENAATNIVIPEGVETIERAVFASSPNLKTASIPSTVVTIGTDYSTTGAFEGCSNLVTVTMAEGTEDAFLGWSTFRNCTSLTDIVIPGNYTAIGQAAFENCSSLRSMEYKQSSYDFANQVIGAYAFSKCTKLGTIKLPTTLKKIGEYAFRESAVTDVVIPEGVETIERAAFASSPNLKTVSIPSTVVTIGTNYSTTGAFEGCPKLTDVTIAEGTRDAFLGWSTFRNCTSLKSVIVPGNYYAIGNAVFEGCTSLVAASLEASDYTYANQTIGDYVFNNCPKLKYVHIPETVKSIGNNSRLSPSQTICGVAGSYAETYANERSIPFSTNYVYPFLDVASTGWYAASVMFAYETGLFTGTTDLTFAPNDQMTRGMLVTVLYRHEGRPIVTGTNKFKDVANSAYYASAVKWASDIELVAGYSDGTFRPNDPITREQISKILYKYAEYKGYDVTARASIKSYSDNSKVAKYAVEYMQWAVAEGYIKGSGNKLNPKGQATRAEIAAILRRFIEQ